MELNELICSIDIVDYISQFVDLELKGEEYWGLSPFKQEHTPSFSVRKESGLFYDFSSGIGGNVYKFAKEYFKCSPRETVEKLKEYAGVGDDILVPHERLAATNSCRKFSKPHSNTKTCTAEILPEDYMDRYEDRSDKLKVWTDEGISVESLDKYQVRYDPFSDRLVYPIRNMEGKIVNIGGRTLDTEWKEKGLRKYTYFFKWGTIDLLYGLYDNLEAIKKKREVIIFEGMKSVLLADTWGIQNTACLLTSHLNSNQMKILAKLGCRAVFALDKEVNIHKDKNIRKLKSYINVEYIYDSGHLLGEKDAPVDRGLEVFNKLYISNRYRLR